MGGSRWSDDEYVSRMTVNTTRATSMGSLRASLNYTAAVDSGAAPKAVNPFMSPSKAASTRSPFVGSVMRESRDSAAHPESLAIGVFFDVTGSMQRIPLVLQQKLAGLMALLTQKGYVEHPQILFGAIGDAYSDAVPLQVGEFESGAEMDDSLGGIYLEGGGGGQTSETYELAHYFFLKHTSTDCWEKRQHKGYLFTMGDEAPYDHVSREQVKRLIGDELQGDVPTSDVIKALEQRYNVFHIIVEQGSYPRNKYIEGKWRALLGERVLLLEDQNNVAELIALTIGLTEGTIDFDTAKDHLKDAGADDKTVSTVSSALVPLAKSGAVTRTAKVEGDLPAVSASGVERL